jgi:hypothetical protein
MAATQGTPSESELLTLVMDRLMRGLAVAQVADIKPMVKRLVPSGTEDREDLEEERPTIPSVRVLHYRAGGFYIHAPLQAGDTVLLVVLDQDPTVWVRTGDIARPADRRLHHLAHAVAIPGLFPSTAALAGLGGNLQLGKEDGFKLEITASRMEVDGSSDAAALASKVDDLASKFNSHIHTTTATVGPGPAVGVISPTTGPYTGGASGSTKLKVGG